jgi:multidrug efflux system membrane fusion protein
MSSSKLRTLVSATAIVSVLAAGGYAYSINNFADAEPVATKAQAQAFPVSVLQIEAKPTRLWSNFSGRLKAVDEVELRPQVSGTIIETRFEDGQLVTKGDILFVIDPRTYKTAVKQAQASLTAARQTLSLAKKAKIRAEELVGNGNVSRRVFDERASAYDVANSQVLSAIATLEQAEISLDHAYVKAPISGRVSQIEITEGNFVSGGTNAPTLTSIVSTNSIYADFEIDEQTYLSQMHRTSQSEVQKQAIPVQLTVGSSPSITGHIHSFDNRINPNTGTIRTRAIFENMNGALLPGMFAKINLGNPQMEPLILLPSSAISTDQDRKFVYTVSPENTVEYRLVTLGAHMNGWRVVTSGLKPKDQVIVEGIMKLRPGMPIAPHPIKENLS